MPAYEYLCRDCDHTFTTVMSIKEHDTAQVKCPTCHGTHVTQLLSTFIAKTAKKS